MRSGRRYPEMSWSSNFSRRPPEKILPTQPTEDPAHPANGGPCPHSQRRTLPTQTTEDPAHTANGGPCPHSQRRTLPTQPTEDPAHTANGGPCPHSQRRTLPTQPEKILPTQPGKKDPAHTAREDSVHPTREDLAHPAAKEDPAHTQTDKNDAELISASRIVSKVNERYRAMYGETATSDAVGVKRGVLFFSIRENEERSGKNSHTALGNREKPQWMKKKGGSIYTVLPKMKSDSSKDFTTTSSSKEDFTTSRSQEDSIDLGSESSLLEAETLHSQYAISKTIGQGAFGKVKLAYHRLTGTQVAIKMIQKKKLWGRPASSEVDIMMSVNHPNIISLLQVIESQKNAYLIMELVKGHELYDYVEEAGHLEEDNARGIFRQILNAVGYCHERGIIHRDLKPDNIMVDWKGKVQIIDFGLGTQVKPGEKLSFHCGTYQFYPPEYFLELFYDGLKVDIWALGVVLYFMVVGRLPFDGDTLPVLRNQIVEGKYTVPVGLSEELQDLLGLLLSMDPSFRPTAQEATAHPWVKDTEVSQSQEEQKITSLPDQVIMQAMHFIGFKTKDIETSVAEKKFNECMASYYFLEGQALQGPSYPTLAQPAFPVVAPLPSIEDSFRPPPRRRSSEPALRTFFRGWQAGLRGERRATECVIPPYRPLQSTLAVDDRQCKSAPPILENSSRDSTSEIAIENSNTDSTSEEVNTSEEVKSTTEEVKSTSSRGQPRRSFRKWSRRLGNAFLRLCSCFCPCCLPSKNKPRWGHNRVSPQR
ncbi:hypothetical protein STEG23_007339 [Scotinomys teguina]